MASGNGAAILGWIRENWVPIAAVVTACAGVLYPGSEASVAKILQLVAAILGATAAGRLAARSEARKLGLIPPR